jgi:RNA polymerase sigma-70 factor, ECF subfamily
VVCPGHGPVAAASVAHDFHVTIRNRKALGVPPAGRADQQAPTLSRSAEASFQIETIVLSLLTPGACRLSRWHLSSIVQGDGTIEDLVLRAQRGESEALEAVARQYLRPAYVVALAVLGRPTDAEDVAQETLILALERIATCREPRLFRSWLLQIARNQAKNWRERGRLRDVPAREPLGEPSAPEPGPDAGAFRAGLLEALNNLGTSEREVVLLHDLEGWTHPEIAEVLGFSVVMSRQHLFQARRKLRARLAGAKGDADE